MDEYPQDGLCHAVGYLAGNKVECIRRAHDITIKHHARLVVEWDDQTD